MFPSEMDNGQSMLDVNIDTNLLSDFFEENNGVPNISDVDCASSAFDWADDFISSASTPYSMEGGSERSPATAGSLPSTSPASSVVETQASTTTPLPQVAQVVVTAGGVIQQLPTTLASQQILHKSSNIIQGISPGTQHFVVKADANGQLQFQPTPGSSPAPTQQFSVPSPAISRSLTPSQSPAPSCSPHISRSITPNQPNIQQALSSSPSPNILHLATPQSQPQVQITNTVPIQSIIPNPSQNASIIPGQAVLSGHAHNIVHTQNAVIQNPNVVNLNVATHVLCGNSQQVGQQPAGQIQSNIQGLPVTVQNTVGLQGNQVSLQGTIIQTPGGKSILIPNQQLGGHQINLGAVHQQVLQGQQLMQGGGTAVLQNTPGSVGVGNVIRLAPQPGQDKPASVVPPNISLVNIGGAQGQQILIQRAPHPAQGQPQNIIFRTVPHPNLIQIQGSQAGQANLQGASLQAASQISQQILNQATSQSVQYQQVLPGGAQPQQVKLVGGQGSHPTSQGVTLNLAGQSLNLLSGQNLNLQQIQGLATSTVGSMPGVQGIQLQQNGSQYIVQPAHTQLGTQPQTVNVSSINQSTNIVSKALISSGLSQVINTQIKQGQEPKSSNSVSESPTVTTTSKSKSKKSKSNPDGQVKGSPQQLAQNFQKIQIPISQFIATASNAAGIHTAQSTPTAVTTTVTQAMVQVPAQLTLANTLSGSQIVSSVQSKSSVGIISTPSTASQIKIQPQVIKSGPPNVTLAPQGTAFQTSNTDPLKLQRVQLEINKLLNQPNLTQDQIQKLGNLQQCLKDSYPSSVIQTSQQNAGTVSPKPIKPLVQASLTAQPMVGQPPIAQPQVVVATAATQIKTEPGTQPISLQSLVSQPGIVVQSQAGGTGVIQLAVPQQTTVTAPATQMITTVAQTGQPQYLQTVIKHGSPTKTIKMAPGGTTQVIQIQSSPVTTATPTRPAVPAGTTVIRTPPPGKMPISATPSLPTQIKIANQMLTLNLTSQQKEKLQQHLGRMTMEQQEMFLKQQQHTLVKLQQQQQQHIHQQIQVIRTTSPQTKPQLLVANPPGKIPITVQQIDKGINQIKVGVDAVQTSTPNRPTKRPAPSDVSKGTLIHQQLGKDQQHAVNPDTKSPFKDYKEACRRLLRYHVFQHHGPKQDAFKKAENVFDTVSEDLLKRSHTMMNKYRLLLLEESMRDRPSAEMVMIQRMLNQDLTAVIKKEKDVIKADPDSFVPMPTKYLKKEKKEEDSAAETSALDTSAVKSETFTESEYSDHDMSESLHQSSASAESERMSVKSSPIVPPGKVKLVIRNDGRGFTSSLKTKTPVKTEPPSPRYGQVTPEETPPKGVVKGESLYINEFQSDHYADERDDLNMSGERGDESGNVLSRELSSANASSDLDTTDLQAGLREPSFQAQLAQSCVSEPGGEERLQAFHHSGDDPLLKVKGSPIASAVSGDSRLEVHQPHYSDISITDVSGDYPSVLSPIQKPLDSGGTVLGEFASQISEDFDPSSFDFPEALTGNLCSQSASVSTVSEPARTAFSSITADDGFHHQMDLGNSRTNQLNVASSPIAAVAAAAAAAHDVYDSDDDGLPFTATPRPHTAAPHGNIEEIDNAVSSIMDFDDVSSDGNVADLSTISSEKDLGSNADVLSSKDLPQNEMMFSPESGPSNSQDENNQSDGMELDASFESDGNDPQNHMMNAQMQSAIDSILSLNQVEDPAAVADFMDQSGSMTSFYDNQLTEVTDTSQDESEYYGEEGGGESEDKPEESGSGDKDGGETSMEDDLDAAVQSILM
ncbi:BRD4-interacting chromatin-remodeling complex-associated protein-like isoform X2 [Haliotis rufescens]|uniref:BRD4-interacting chromatin-remodeling complex-associated protein-like isoform X2 n=1 Tax=Haliotis rufescens TaxID=6454 RepID=UPI00201F2CB6|nr:BRD4-interacting chromatin-remodeling complex-associated protein-like isoform X2 [Haliotis rufescens]